MAWTPMEPSKKTLIVMVAGINPRQGGLFRSGVIPHDYPAPKKPGEKSAMTYPDYDREECNDDGGHAHIFRTFGLRTYLEANATGNSHFIYSRALTRPHESPIELGKEIGDRTWTPQPWEDVTQPTHCEGRRKVIERRNGQFIVDPVIDVNHDFHYKNLLEDAVLNWLNWEFRAYKRNDIETDPDVKAWIDATPAVKTWINNTWKMNDPGIDPGLDAQLAQLRKDRPFAVPSRFIPIVHSMGGNDIKEYILSDYYAGDVDKVITLDTPHGGSWATQANIEILKTNLISIERLQAALWVTSGALILTFSDKEAVDVFGTTLIMAGALNGVGEWVLRDQVLSALTQGYGTEDGANRYLIATSNDLKAINAKTAMATPFTFPPHRLFHTEGVICAADNTLLASSHPAAGFIFPNAISNFLYNFSGHLGMNSYSGKVDKMDKVGNGLLAGILSGAANLNFAEQGSSVVPYWSSRGDVVSMFGLPGSDVQRKLYTIDSESGFLPAAAAVKAIDYYLLGMLANTALNSVARAYPPSATIAKLSKFPLNYTTSLVAAAVIFQTAKEAAEAVYPDPDVLAKQNLEIDEFGEVSFGGTVIGGNIASSHDWATIHSPRFMNTATIPMQEGPALKVDYADIEAFIYEAPFASLKTSRSSGKVFVGIRDVAGVPLYEFPESQLDGIKIDYTQATWQGRMGIKHEAHRKILPADANSPLVRDVTRHLLPNETKVKSYPETFEFTVDDYRPDLLATFTANMNGGHMVFRWDRQANGKYKVYRKIPGSSELVYFREEASPIGSKGDWNFRPKDYFSITPFKDGQNSMSLAFTNHIGKTNVQTFHFLAALTQPLVVPNWIAPYSVVNTPKPRLEILVNGQFYAEEIIDVSETKFKIYPRTDGGSEDGAAVPYAAFDQPPGADFQGLQGTFRHAWSAGTGITTEGNYWLQVKVATTIGAFPSGADTYRVPFTVDFTPPVLSLGVPETSLNPSRGSIPLKLSFQDPPVGQLQTARLRITDIDGNPVWELPPMASMVSAGMETRWTGKHVDGSDAADGEYIFAVTARDGGLPDLAGRTLIEDLMREIPKHVDNGAPRAPVLPLWTQLEGNSGFTLATASKRFRIDRTAPAFELVAGFPARVGAGALQSLSFKVADASNGLPGAKVKVRWHFIQGLGGIEWFDLPFDQDIELKSATLGGAPTEHIAEVPGLLDFTDGRYRIRADVEDGAGNTQQYSDPSWTFHIDRSAPAIGELFIQDLADKLLISWKVAEPDDDNRTPDADLVSGTTATIADPDGLSTNLTVTAKGAGRFEAQFPKSQVVKQGAWSVEVRTRDLAGNVGKDSWTHHEGHRPPSILYPADGKQVSGRISIQGIARSPSATEAFGSYTLEWSERGTGVWHSAGIEVPISRRGPGGVANRSVESISSSGYLGSWDLSALTEGEEYELRLSTESAGGATKAFAIHLVYKSAESASGFSTEIVDLPAAYSVGDGEMKFGLRITSDAASGREYTARIVMTDAAMTPLLERVPASLSASKFNREPADKAAPGVYLWHGDDGQWHLHVTAAAEAYKFNFTYSAEAAPVYKCTGNLACKETAGEGLGLNIPDMPGGGDWNRTLEISAPAGSTGDVVLALPSPGIFLPIRVNPSTPEQPLLPSADFFAGAGKRQDFGPYIMAIPIQPVPFSYEVKWDGLTAGGAFPGSGPAMVDVIVEETSSRQVRQVSGAFTIESDDLGLEGQLRNAHLDFDPENTLGQVILDYKVTGTDGFISAVVRRSTGSKEVVKSFLAQEKQDVRPAGYTLGWNGIRDNHLTVTDGETYEFFLEARDAKDGPVRKTLVLPFQVSSTRWKEASDASTFSLSVEEAANSTALDALVVQPEAKFRIMATPQGSMASLSSFNYSVTHSGAQRVLAYPSDRFNVFIRRQREEIRFVAVMRVSTQVRGENYTFWDGCEVSRPWQDHYMIKQITIQKDQVLDFDTEDLAPYQGNEWKYTFKCTHSSKCEKDANRMVFVKILPADAWSEAIGVMNSPMDRRLAAFNSLQPLLEIPAAGETIQIFDNTVNRIGTNGAIVKSVAPNNWLIRNDDPTTNCEYAPENDKNRNLVIDKDEKCKSGVNFNPEKNLIDVGFWYRDGQTSWTYDKHDFAGCQPEGHKRQGFRMRMQVPEAYWNPRFGYENMANACLRFDPTNKSLYDANDGYFTRDDFDNNRNCATGLAQPCLVDNETNGYLTPFNRQVFRWTPVVMNQVAGPTSVVSTTTWGNLQGFTNPLNFSNKDHSLTKAKEKIQIGFNGSPIKYGGGAMFELLVKKETCLASVQGTPDGTCPNNAGSLQTVRVLNNQANQWEGAQPPHEFAIDPIPEPSGIFGLTLFTNYQFEVRLRARPTDLFVPNLQNSVMDWPFIESNFKLVQDGLRSGPSESQLHLFRGVSGIRYGRNDLQTESGNLPTHLVAGGAYVDATTGYFLPGIDPDAIPAGTNRNAENAFPLTGTLSLQGGKPVWIDNKHFDKLPPYPAPGAAYNNTQDGSFFGSNVTVTRAAVSAPPGLVEGFTEVDLAGKNVGRFEGATLTPWSGVDDAHLQGRDLDDDGRASNEDGLDNTGGMTFYDEDGDLATDEDPAGTLVGTFTLDPITKAESINLLSQVYPMGVKNSASNPKSLLNKDGAGNWVRNANIAGLSFSNLSLRYLDGSPHEDLAIIEEKTVGGDPVIKVIGPVGYGISGDDPVQMGKKAFRRAKEFITLKGRVPGEYEIGFVDGSGAFRTEKYGPRPNAGKDRILGYFDVNKLQGSTSLFLLQRSANEVVYKKVDLYVGKPLESGTGLDQTASSILGDAEILFPGGSLPSTQAVTVRVTNPADFDFTKSSKIAPIGPIVEVLPSQEFTGTNLPKVKVTIPKGQLESSPGVLDPTPSEIRLYKPDRANNSFVELMNLEYVFKNRDGGTACQNATGLCDPSLWETLTLQGDTRSFSQFLVLRKDGIESRPFTMAVAPKAAATAVRTLTVEGLGDDAFNVYVDEDENYNEENDPVPPVLITPATVIERSSGRFVATYDIPFSSGRAHVSVVPHKENSLVKTQAIDIYSGAYSFEYLGDAVVYAGTVNGDVTIPYQTNQPGILEVSIGKNGTEVAAFTAKLEDFAGTAVDKGAAASLAPGNYKTTLKATGATGESMNLLGPTLFTDGGLPKGYLSGTSTDANGGVNVTVYPDYWDEQSGIRAASVILKFSGRVYSTWDVYRSFDYPSLFLDETDIRGCFGCKVTAELHVEDLGGNHIMVSWQSAPIGRVPSTVWSLGITGQYRLHPARVSQGEKAWKEDANPDGGLLKLGTRSYYNGISVTPKAAGATAWAVYDLKSEAARLGIAGEPLSLSGVAGFQAAGQDAAVLVKLSHADAAPSDNDWLNGTGSVRTAFNSNSRSEAAVNVNLLKAKWLWVGVRSASGAGNTAAGVLADAYLGFGAEPAYPHVKTITLNTTPMAANVAKEVKSFPVLVRLDRGNFDFPSALPNGRDLRFHSTDGIPLPFEIESWDGARQTASVWVKTDVPANGKRTIAMKWGDADAPGASSGESVFGVDDQFAAVWHLGENGNGAAGGYLDATQNLLDGTGNGMVGREAEGMIGGAQSFGGSTTFIRIPDSENGAVNFNKNSNFTVSAWVKSDALDSKQRPLVSKGDHQYGLQVAADNSWEFAEKQQDGWDLTTTPAKAKEWAFVTGVRQGTSQRLYVDGVLVDDVITNVCPGCAGRNKTFPVLIGANAELPTLGFNGLIDEVRLSSTNRSAEWIKLSYENQKAVQSLVEIPEDYDRWGHSQIITLNTAASGADVEFDVQDFPVLIRLDGSNFPFSQAMTRGEDVRFATLDGQPLTYEIERWDFQRRKAEVWVRVPVVKGASRIASLKVYWGLEGAKDKSRGKAVFDAANGHVAVWHLGEDGNISKDGYKDASFSAFNGTGYSFDKVSDVEGAVGKAQSFNGASYIDIPGSSTGALNFPEDGGYTLSAWVWSDDLTSSDHPIIMKGNNQWALKSKNTGLWEFHEKQSAGYDITVHPAVTGKWKHLVGIRSGTSQYLFVDGELVDDQLQNTWTGGRSTGFNVNIGREAQVKTEFWKGRIDEVRVSNVARPAPWVWLNYENQKSGQKLVELPALDEPEASALGLNFAYYEGKYNSESELRNLTPVKTGVVETFDLAPKAKTSGYAFAYDGFIQVEMAGEYTFYAVAGSTSDLFVDDILVVSHRREYTNSAYGTPEKNGKVWLEPGFHKIHGSYFGHSLSNTLVVSWSGPSLAKELLPGSVLWNTLDERFCLAPAHGVRYQYFEGNYSKVADMAGATPVEELALSTYSLSPLRRSEQFGFAFKGSILIKATGGYDFFTQSDDGSLLYIDGVKIVDNDGVHPLQERMGTVQLTAGIHAIEVRFFQKTGGQGLTVSYAGPGIAKQPIPTQVLFQGTLPVPPVTEPCTGTGCGKANAIVMGGETFDVNYTLSGDQWFKVPLSLFSNTWSHTVVVALDDMDRRPMEGQFQFETGAPRTLNTWFQSFPAEYSGQAELYFHITVPTTRTYKVRWWFQ